MGINREGFKPGHEPVEPDDWGPTSGFFQGERQGSSKLGEHVSDEILREKVRSELMISTLVDASYIDVGADSGKIILKGSVPDEEMKVAAVELSKGVEGVKEVVSYLEISKSKAA